MLFERLKELLLIYGINRVRSPQIKGGCSEFPIRISLLFSFVCDRCVVRTGRKGSHRRTLPRRRDLATAIAKKRDDDNLVAWR